MLLWKETVGREVEKVSLKRGYVVKGQNSTELAFKKWKVKHEKARVAADCDKGGLLLGPTHPPPPQSWIIIFKTHFKVAVLKFIHCHSFKLPSFLLHCVIAR